MTKSEINEKLETLNTQLKSVESTWMKVQGAIEFCNALLEEKEESKASSSNGVAKEKKEKATVS